MKYFLLTISFILFTGRVIAADVIVDFTSNSVPVLNEELRKIRKDASRDTLKKAYPVGSIYISTVSTNPYELFGFGTWVEFGNGRVLVGVDTGQTEFNAPGKTGGEKTHALTEAENAPHKHRILASYDDGTGGGWSERTIRPWNDSTPGVYLDDGSCVSSGSGAPHNNLQPYIVVYMFERTL